MSQELKTLAEMARHLRRSERQFRDDVRTYNIPHITLGRAKMFDASRVELYLESIEESKKPERANSRRGVKAVTKYAEALGL